MTRLKRLGIDFPFLIAPMVGISHVAFRELIRSYVPEGTYPLLFTEMLSTRKLLNQRLELDEFPMTSTGECCFVPQLLGNEESFIASSISRLLPLNPWGFDINMGCPASGVLQHNWGVRLMGDRNYAAEIVKMTKRHSPRPVSVKLRAALDRSLDLGYLLDFTAAVEDAGADWMTLHCRSAGQGHRGAAHWDMVAEVSRQRSIPVVANGDIQTWQDALMLIRDYAVDGAMIARAATARPWILWQLAHKQGNVQAPACRKGDSPPWTPEEEGAEYFRSILRLSCLMDQYFVEEKRAMKQMLFYVCQSSRWLPFGHHFFQNVRKSRNTIELRDFVNDYAEKFPQPITARVLL